MLGKMLKYDLASMWRIWLVLSITVFAMSPIAGLCVRGIMFPLDVDGPIEVMLFLVSYLGIMLYSFCISIYAGVTYYLSVYRFYKNLFTDEGYLTFTLPVKRSTILNAKLINSLIWSTATYFIIAVSLLVITLIAPSPTGGGTLLSDIITGIGKDLSYMFLEDGFGLAVFWGYLIIISLLSSVFMSLLMYACVTIGSIIVKKYKLLMSILVYYIVNIVMSFLAYVVGIVGSICALTVLAASETFSEVSATIILYLAPIAVIMFLIVLCVAIYSFILHSIEKKLNLA